MDVDDEDEEPESEEEVRYNGDTPLGPLPSFLVTYRSVELLQLTFPRSRRRRLKLPPKPLRKRRRSLPLKPTQRPKPTQLQRPNPAAAVLIPISSRARKSSSPERSPAMSARLPRRFSRMRELDSPNLSISKSNLSSSGPRPAQTRCPRLRSSVWRPSSGQT